jgi:hypothetical protein
MAPHCPALAQRTSERGRVVSGDRAPVRTKDDDHPRESVGELGHVEQARQRHAVLDLIHTRRGDGRLDTVTSAEPGSRGVRSSRNQPAPWRAINAS